MSKLAAQFFVALALATETADAAVTCATGYTVKTTTGVDKLYCTSDAASCMKDPTCCKAPAAPTAKKTCLSEEAKITCDKPKVNRLDSTEVGADAPKTLTACCSGKATCDAATCPAGTEKLLGNKASVCAGVAACLIAANSDPCCKVKTGTCGAWKAKAPTTNVCSATKHEVAGATTGDAADKCCADNVMCSTYTLCPAATHELIADKATKKCAMGSCTNDVCCQWKKTTCKGQTGIACGANKYLDQAKNSVVFTDKLAGCCTAQAQCKDSGAAVVASSSTVAAPTFLAMVAILAYGAAK